MACEFRYQHIRNTNPGEAPSSSYIREGEIAVNIAADNERIYLKNTNNEIVEFISENEIDSKIEASTIAPDEEDVTKESNVLKFKNRSTSHGMGKVIVRMGKTFAEQLTQSNTIYEIRYDFNLGNDIVEIPNDSVLEFVGGYLSNGTIIGSNTQIVANRDIIFDGITIEGTWNVPDITSVWFGDATQNNKLKNVFALQNEHILNNIVIEKGNYSVSVSEEKETVFDLKSNLNLTINGTITLESNSFEAYVIFQIKGESHISINGSGSIVGDKPTHTGTEGQWGHGISIVGTFVTVKDIAIKDCWGDCIYIGQGSSGTEEIENIVIDNCLIDNARRQGISVTSANNVIITNCHIINVGGHNPQAAIDIETNEGKLASNIFITNCRIDDCILGITIYGRGDYTKSCISIDNCHIKCKQRAIAVNGVSTSINISNCELFTRFHVVDSNTVDGSKDNVILFENNLIYQIPEEGDDMSTDSRGCAIYAAKGNYKFHHNFIECVLPVFRFASGAKYVEDNEIVCDSLFYVYRANSVIIRGNKITGNVAIPGTSTILENNTINGLLKSTAVNHDNKSIIRGNTINHPTENNELTALIDELLIEGNRFTNVKMSMDGGVVANNLFEYDSNFTLTGQLLNLGHADFVNNTIEYNGTHSEDSNIYMVRTSKSVIGNNFSSSSIIKYALYVTDGCFVSGNKISLPADSPVNSIISNAKCTIIPSVSTRGTYEERPNLPVGERYYIGCKYFDTTIQKSLIWNGYVWLNENNEPVDYANKTVIDGYTLGKKIYTNVSSGTVINTVTVDAEYDCNMINVHAGELYVISGVGGFNYTTYALLTSSKELVYHSPAFNRSSGIPKYPFIFYVLIEEDGKLVLNFNNASALNEVTDDPNYGQLAPYYNQLQIPYGCIKYSN